MIGNRSVHYALPWRINPKPSDRANGITIVKQQD